MLTHHMFSLSRLPDLYAARQRTIPHALLLPLLRRSAGKLRVVVKFHGTNLKIPLPRLVDGHAVAPHDIVDLHIVEVTGRARFKHTVSTGVPEHKAVVGIRATFTAFERDPSDDRDGFELHGQLVEGGNYDCRCWSGSPCGRDCCYRRSPLANGWHVSITKSYLMFLSQQLYEYFFPDKLRVEKRTDSLPCKLLVNGLRYQHNATRNKQLFFGNTICKLTHSNIHLASRCSGQMHF